jgi:alpha-glucosidase (family GH31 glycosyl hydrolase)
MASAFQPMGIVRDVLPLQWKDIYYEDRVTYDDLIFKAMEIKMSWYRYYSTGLVHNHDVGGIHLLKPLFFEFPDDTASYAADQAQNFMIGSSLKVSLGTTPGQN